jgi:hypothetical protein
VAAALGSYSPVRRRSPVGLYRRMKAAACEIGSACPVDAFSRLHRERTSVLRQNRGVGVSFAIPFTRPLMLPFLDTFCDHSKLFGIAARVKQR